MNKFFDRNTSVCVTGRFDQLERLDMSENSIIYIEPSFIHPLVKLHHLNLARNRLGEAISIENYGKSLFRSLQTVEILDISDNEIKVIPKGSFIFNKHLKILDLSQNKLESIDFGIDDLISLEHLDISDNEIVTVEAGDCVILKKLYLRKNMNDSSSISHDENVTQTHVNFKDNPFSCPCENVCLLTFISELNDTYTCVENNKTLVIDDLRARKALYMCKEFIIITVFSTLAATTVMLISITIYFVVKEQRLKQLKRLKEMGIENYERGHKKYAVFLSFSGDDEEFIMTDVYPNLNSGLKKVLNIEDDCVATGGTDFRPGYSIKDEIV